jgi:hypothetical protein
MTHRSAINKAQQHLTCVFPQQSITAQCLRFPIATVITFWRFKLLQMKGLSLFSPGMPTRLGKPAPSHYVCVAHRPTLFYSADSSDNQGITSLFSRSYSGSGELIQSLARCPPTLRRCKATRIRSMLTSRWVTSSSK